MAAGSYMFMRVAASHADDTTFAYMAPMVLGTIGWGAAIANIRNNRATYRRCEDCGLHWKPSCVTD
jgi:hypothetical protein